VASPHESAKLRYESPFEVKSLEEEFEKELEGQTKRLEGATMPNGQKYEDWLKDR
jgi:hypothetical protein